MESTSKVASISKFSIKKNVYTRDNLKEKTLLEDEGKIKI